jgi:hypothetical protein
VTLAALLAVLPLLETSYFGRVLSTIIGVKERRLWCCLFGHSIRTKFRENLSVSETEIRRESHIMMIHKLISLPGVKIGQLLQKFKLGYQTL